MQPGTNATSIRRIECTARDLVAGGVVAEEFRVEIFRGAACGADFGVFARDPTEPVAKILECPPNIQQNSNHTCMQQCGQGLHISSPRIEPFDTDDSPPPSAAPQVS